MALKTAYSAENCRIDAALCVTYAMSPIYGSWSYAQGVGIVNTINRVYAFTRHATMAYRYVGMTKAAAESCKAAMIAQYTRTVKNSIWDGDTVGTAVSLRFTEPSSDQGEAVMADIQCVNTDGEAWEVLVNVNEIDQRLRATPGHTYSSLFSSENQRAYGHQESN